MVYYMFVMPVPEEKSIITVLVVDDDKFARELLSRIMESLGYHWFEADNGLNAIEVLSVHKVDIIITDVQMPKMGGFELLEYTLDNHPDTDVIVATGLSDQTNYPAVIKAGAIDFINKPFHLDELEAKLSRVIREREIIQRLERLSMCDALTGLYNRRAYDIKLAEEVQRAFRQDYDIILGMIDVDNFKGYNDTFGHQKGDLVLQGFGKILLSCTRENVDFCFRYGGDEFTFLLTRTDKDQAHIVAERIKNQYQKAGFGETSVSIGLVAGHRYLDSTWSEDVANMISLADQACYQAKNNGKNKIAWLDATLSSPH